MPIAFRTKWASLSIIDRKQQSPREGRMVRLPSDYADLFEDETQA